MWLSVTIVCAAFTTSYAFKAMIQFRSPNENISLSTNETLEDPNSVSLFYADEYVLFGIVYAPFVYAPQLLRNYPCLLMEPAYSLVQDHMTLYGTCNHQDMFRLELKRFNGQWTAKVKLSNGRCQDDLIENFELNWHGVNHTVVSRNSRFKTVEEVVDLLPHEKGMNYGMVRTMYPVLNYTNWVIVREKLKCQCLDGSEFDFLKKWIQLCPES